MLNIIRTREQESMTPKQFIEKAIEGGWKNSKLYMAADYLQRKDFYDVPLEFLIWIFLDPKSWAAVGKVEYWGKTGNGIPMGTPPEILIPYGELHQLKPIPKWQYNMHLMIDALCEGKSIEQFLENLSD